MGEEVSHSGVKRSKRSPISYPISTLVSPSTRREILISYRRHRCRIETFFFTYYLVYLQLGRGKNFRFDRIS